ncbi:MAG: BON domain-containing protein [Steroidobacteraceae bacterium]
MYQKQALCVIGGLCMLVMGTVAAADQHPIKDSYITTKVKSELVGDFGKRAAHIHVHTRHGVVALDGWVDSHGARDRAALDARHIKGVVDVVDNLKVER